jgi:carnitine monooxygenase subunit
MTALDDQVSMAPTRFPRELTRRIVDNMRDGTQDCAEHAMTEPADVFTDSHRWQREIDQFFRRGSHVVGWTGELPRPGTYITKDVAGLPVVITRDEHGELHAFKNACTHRGAAVADGCGEARRLTCPYHAWSFDLTGKLAGQPEAHHFDEIERSTLGLQPLPLADVHGLLVVGLSDDADPAAALADIAPELAGYRYDTHEVVCHHQWTIQANWKITVDVNLEAYHVAHLHRETLHELVVNNAIHDTFGRNARWAFPTRYMNDALDKSESEWPEPALISVVHTFFPSCVVLETPVSSQMFRIYPGRHVGESTVHLTEASIAPVQSDEERAARVAGADFAALIVGKEDFPAAETCQRGAEIGLTRFVFGKNEPMLQHWHRTWREALDD